MAKCWEEYMEKVHDAIALDPWASEVQLLDIFVGKRRGKGWLRRLMMLPRRKMMTAMREVERAGSMLNLGAAMEEEGEGGRSWREEMEEERRESQEEMMREEEEEEEAGPPSEKTSSSSSDSSQKPQDQTSSSSTQKTITAAAAAASSSSEKSHSSQQTPHKSRNKKPNKRSLMFRVLSMADMQTSIKTSGSALASLTLSSAGAGRGSVDLDGATSVSCTVSGVKSHRVSVDGLMDLLVSCSWTPNISRPEFAWDFKRGQTLWVVTEILYAKKISIQGDIKTNAENTANVQATITNNVDGNGSTEIKMERDGAWVVTAPKDRLFPFALRVKQLDYDATGDLKSNKFLLRRDGSLNNEAKLLPSRSVIQPQQIFNHWLP